WHHQRSGYSFIEWIVGFSFWLSTRRQVARRVPEVPGHPVNPRCCRGTHPANDSSARVGDDQDDRGRVLFGFGSKLVVGGGRGWCGFSAGFSGAFGYRFFSSFVGGFFSFLLLLLPGL